MMQRTVNKVLSVVLVCLLLLGAAAPVMEPAAAASGDTLYIREANDFVKLSRSCSLDTWSRGKTVVLLSDISMEGIGFVPIPSFGGTFDGGGHTVSGLKISGEPYPAGMFGIVQPGGVIKNLNVSGSVLLDGDGDTAGGIAGINCGKLMNCTFYGTVNGKKTVGGIAGQNETTGQLIQCTFEGLVTGEHYVGGIAGQNAGSILQCENAGSVNTDAMEISLELSDLPALSGAAEITERRSMERLPAGTDIGGVAGLSTGLLEGCKNKGDVGYEHIGYNVGGIVGRQSGYLHGCTNSGRVRGRKDVGGIAGQMEPQVTLKYDADTLSRLLDELDVMKDLMDQTLADADNTSGSLSAGINSLTASVRTAKDCALDLSDAVTDWANGNVDKINDAAARISWTISEMSPIADDIADSLKKMERASGQLADGLDSIGDASHDGVRSLDDLKEAAADVGNALKEAESALKKLQQALELLRKGMTDPTVIPQAVALLRDAVGNLGKASADLSASVKHVSDGVADLKAAGGHLEDGMDDLSKASDRLADGLDILQDAVDDTAGVLNTLSKKPDIEFDTIGSDLTKRGDDLDGAFSDMLDRMDNLNNIVTGTSDTLIGDFQAINNQMSVIIDVLRDGSQREKDEKPEDHFEDISDEELSSGEGMGRILAAGNTGTVEGDINVAGVVGSLAIEYDFDPEDDLTEEGDRSLDFRYQAAAVVKGSVSDGHVKSKKNYAGGVVGRMDLGTVFQCESYGKIESADGDYVGGIAGFSDAAVRNCYAKCTLSGNHYVGGVLGAGSEDSTVMRCYVMPRVSVGEGRIGAVSGSAEGTFADNYFVSEQLAGLGRVSYAGKAEPMEYETMRQVPGLPEAMRHFTLKFVLEDKVLSSRSFEYGESFDDSVYPEAEAPEGFYLQWDVTELTDLRFDTEVTAALTPYVTALTTSDTRENGRSVFYVEGAFRRGDRANSALITGSGVPDEEHTGAAAEAENGGDGATENNAGGADGNELKTKLFKRWGKTPLEQWHLTFDDDGHEKHTIHYLPADTDGGERRAKKLQVYVKQNGEWQAVSGRSIGQYLAFEASGCDMEIAVFKKAPVRWLWLLLIPAALLLIRIMKKRKIGEKIIRVVPRTQSAD